MVVEKSTIDGLRQTCQGDIITPDDPRYEAGRRVWNALVDKRPALMVRPRSAADVSRAIAFARDYRLAIAVRGGAHSVAGRGTCDDGLVIDFSDMKGIRVDAGTRTACAEAGVKWTELDRETQAVGLATTGGTVGDTGIAGLTLGGGFGWLGGRLGMTVDNLLSADVVLASGERVRASAQDNSDLFWAIRGGGGNFGVVTSFEYRLHPIGPTIVGGMVIHPFAAASDVLRFFREVLAGAADDFTVAAALLTGPDGQKAIALACAHAGTVEEGIAAVQPIKAFGSPAMDVIGPIPYVGQQSLLDQAMPPNLLNYWKADFIHELTDDFIEMWVDAFSRVASPVSSMLLFPIHGVASRVAADRTAYPHRNGIHAGIYSLWNDPTRNRQNIAWVRDTWEALQPFVPGGVYVNELGEDEGDDRVRQAYVGNFDRLTRIKAKYDPQNLFCLNANIKPSAFDHHADAHHLAHPLGS